MSAVSVDWIGWVATCLFATSYLCRTPQALRWVQASAALLWVAYGLLLHAQPVVVANLVVAGFAVWSSLRPATVSVQSGERNSNNASIHTEPGR